MSQYDYSLTLARAHASTKTDAIFTPEFIQAQLDIMAALDSGPVEIKEKQHSAGFTLVQPNTGGVVGQTPTRPKAYALQVALSNYEAALAEILRLQMAVTETALESLRFSGTLEKIANRKKASGRPGILRTDELQQVAREHDEMINLAREAIRWHEEER